MPISKQQGGDFLSTVVDLAVPFGLILAARSLQNRQKGTTKTKTKSITAKATVKAVKAVKAPKQNGGSATSEHEDCALCTGNKRGGGSARQMSNRDLVKEFRSLTSDIRGMLERF